jgi:hypothetical protein
MPLCASKDTSENLPQGCSTIGKQTQQQTKNKMGQRKKPKVLAGLILSFALTEGGE